MKKPTQETSAAAEAEGAVDVAFPPKSAAAIALPQVLGIRLDHVVKRRWFEGTRITEDPAIVDLECTEAELVQIFVALSGEILETALRDAMHEYLRRRIIPIATRREGKFPGSSIAKFEAAYAKLIAERVPLRRIGPAKLAEAAGVPNNRNSAKKWLERRKCGVFSPEVARTKADEARMLSGEGDAGTPVVALPAVAPVKPSAPSPRSRGSKPSVAAKTSPAKRTAAAKAPATKSPAKKASAPRARPATAKKAPARAKTAKKPAVKPRKRR